MARSGSFTPWHVDYWWGLWWLSLGVAGSWWLVASGHRFFAVGVALWLTIKGWQRVSCGLARERGIAVERRAVAMFGGVASGQGCRSCADIPMTFGGVCYGNIDLVVSPAWTQAVYVVEIKSFSGIVRRWYGLCREGKYYRLWSPQKQVRGQCRYLGNRWHFPVLWLPESKLNTWLIHNGVLVVNGDVDALIFGLQRFDEVVRLPVVVRFPFPPGDSYTRYLMQRRFKYDGERWMWNGVCSKATGRDLAVVVAGARGGVEWIGREGV